MPAKSTVAYACTVPKKPAKPKKKGKGGRPSKLNPERQKRIVEALGRGCTNESAAAIGGITRKTLQDWLRRGRNSSHGVYRDFLLAAQHARAEGEQALLRDIALDDDWRAKAWILERRWSDAYSKKTEAERRKLEAEADLFEAKASLARAAREKLTGTLVVELGDGGGGSDLAGDLTDLDLAELIVSELGD